MQANRKQVNILANNALEAKMIRLAKRMNVGYSVFPMSAGQGETGSHSSSTDGGGSFMMFMMVITLDKVDTMIEEIQKIKDRSYPLRVFMNDTYVMDEKDFH